LRFYIPLDFHYNKTLTRIAARVMIAPSKQNGVVKITSDEMVKKLQDDGWYPVGQRGSHRNFKHPTKPGKATVPMGRKDLPKGTEKQIIKQTELQ